MLFNRRWTCEALVELALPSTLRLLFLIYPLVTKVAFDAVPCYEFADGTRFLKADVSIECDTAQHERVQWLAWAAIAIYPVGLLVLNASLLVRVRKAVKNARPTLLSRATSFLHTDYEPHLFWWELIEMLRRFILIGVMVRVYNGTMVQLVIGALAAMSLLLIQVQASPYISRASNHLAIVCSFAVCCVFLCCLAFKYASLTDLEDIRGKMNRKQSMVYVFDTAFLSGIIILSVFSALVISTGIFVVQAIMETARSRREALANKARRLRYRKDDKEVPAPPLLRSSSSSSPSSSPFRRRFGEMMQETSTRSTEEESDGAYHTFLSHVWGTGQDQMRIVKQRLLEMSACPHGASAPRLLMP